MPDTPFTSHLPDPSTQSYIVIWSDSRGGTCLLTLDSFDALVKETTLLADIGENVLFSGLVTTLTTVENIDPDEAFEIYLESQVG